jgi:hypothetical protein
MKKQRFYVYEDAVYTNLYEVEAASEQEALAVVKRGDALIEHSQLKRVIQNSYRVRKQTDKEKMDD